MCSWRFIKPTFLFVDVFEKQCCGLMSSSVASDNSWVGGGGWLVVAPSLPALTSETDELKGKCV